MNQKLSSYQLKNGKAPFIHEKWSAQWIMLQVLIALLFPFIASVYFFSFQTFTLVGAAILGAVISEYLFEKLVRKRETVRDLSAVVTGALVGLSMPNGAQWFTSFLLSVGAVVFVKGIFGGLGKNRLNPAVTMRCIYLLAPWTVNFLAKTDVLSTASSVEAITSATPTDLVSSATPLYYISSGVKEIPEGAQSLINIIVGDVGGWGGSLGEISAVALLLSYLFLVFRGIIDWRLPLLCVATVASIMFFYSGMDFVYMLYHIFSGSLIFGAVFMITDYSSGGLTNTSRIFFAIGTGILIAFFRIISFSPEGTAMAIVIMNLLIPFVDKLTMPRIYGTKKRPKVSIFYNSNQS